MQIEKTIKYCFFEMSHECEKRVIPFIFQIRVVIMVLFPRPTELNLSVKKMAQRRNLNTIYKKNSLIKAKCHIFLFSLFYCLFSNSYCSSVEKRYSSLSVLFSLLFFLCLFFFLYV